MYRLDIIHHVGFVSGNKPRRGKSITLQQSRAIILFLAYVCGLNMTDVWQVNQDTSTSLFSLFTDSLLADLKYHHRTRFARFVKRVHEIM